MNIPYNYIQTLKQLPKHGLDQDQIDAASENVSNLSENLEKLKTLTSSEIIPGFTELDKVVAAFRDTTTKSNITFASQVNQLRKNAAAILNLTKVFTAFEQRNVGLQKTFKLTTGEAATLGRNVDNIAVRFNRSGTTLRKYTSDLNKLLPGFQNIITSGGKAGNSLLKIQDAFQQQLGLSGDLANSFALFSGGNEEVLTSQLQIVKGIEAQTNGLVKARDIVGDVANLSANLQIQFGRIPGSLELAVLKARTLGISFERIAAIGNNLLDVEGSINNELEYQLVSGRRLTDENGKNLLNQFRVAALQGDANAQADALNKIVESQGDVLEKNVLARQQLAKTLGIEESQLSKILQQRKLIEKTGAQSLLGLQGSDLEEGIAKFKKDFKGNINDLNDLLATFDNRSTDQMLVEVLGSLEAFLAQSIDPAAVVRQQAKILKDARQTAVKEVRDESGQVITPAREAGALQEFARSGIPLITQVTKAVGLSSTVFQELGPVVRDLQKTVPIIGNIATQLTELLNKINQRFVFYGTAPDPAAPVTAVPTKETPDAIVRVNDAVLFDPNDKINIVASTSQGTLDRVTSGIGGGNSGPSAKEIGEAVAQALQGVNLYVSPNELAAEMAFNSYNINA